MTTIEVVSRSNRIAITDNSDICPITIFLDGEGHQTDDASEAVWAIGKLPDGKWFLADLREYEQVSNQ